jgi:uncharacterized membrane protein
MGHRVSTDGVPDWKTSDPIGFVWRSGRMTRLPGAPAAIAKDGSVVGARGRNAFLWRNGLTTILPRLIANRASSARAINARGQILGVSAGHAVVWRSGRIQDLGPGDPTAINDRGWIVGARNGRAALWTPSGS